MEEMKSQETAKREAQREYMRNWRKCNPDKVQAAQERFWAKKIAEMKKMEKQESEA